MSKINAIWYIPDESNQPSGPFTANHIFRQYLSAKIGEKTLCWRHGMQDWRPLMEIEPFGTAIRGAKNLHNLIKLSCECGNRGAVAVKSAGRKVRCKICGRIITIPAVPQETEVPETLDLQEKGRNVNWVVPVVGLVGLAVIIAVVVYLVTRPTPEEKAAREFVRDIQNLASQVEKGLKDPSGPTITQAQPHRQQSYRPVGRPAPRTDVERGVAEFNAAQKEKWSEIAVEPFTPVLSHNVTALALDGDDLWIGGQNQVKTKYGKIYQPQTDKFTTMVYNPKWICKYNTQTGEAITWDNKDGIAAYPIDIKVTPEDVWVLSGKESHGLGLVQRFRRKTGVWMTYKSKDQGLNLGWGKSLWVSDDAVWITFGKNFYGLGGITRLDPKTGHWEHFTKEQGGLPHPSGSSLAGGPDGIFAVSESMGSSSICKLADGFNRWEIFRPLAEHIPQFGSLVYHNGFLAWSERSDKHTCLCLYDLRNDVLRKFQDPLHKNTIVLAFDGRFLWLGLKGVLFKPNEPLGRLDTENGYIAWFNLNRHIRGSWEIRNIEPAGKYVWIVADKQGLVRMKQTEYPSILSTVPPDGMEDVPPETEISVTFSHGMQWMQEQFNNQAVQLWAGAARMQANVRYDPITRKATLVLTGPLDPGLPYEVRIKAGLRDIYDEPLTKDFILSFSTAER